MHFWIPFSVWSIFIENLNSKFSRNFIKFACSTLRRPRPSGASTAPPSQRDSLDTMPSWTTSSTFQAERNEEKDAWPTFLILFLHIILPCCLRFWSSVSWFSLQVADVHQIAFSSHRDVQSFMDQFSQGEEPAPNLETAAETVVDRDESPSKALALGLFWTGWTGWNSMDRMDRMATCQLARCEKAASCGRRSNERYIFDLRRGLKVGKVPWRPSLRVPALAARNSSKSACTVTLVALVALGSTGSARGIRVWKPSLDFGLRLKSSPGPGMTKWRNDFAHAAKRAYACIGDAHLGWKKMDCAVLLLKTSFSSMIWLSTRFSLFFFTFENHFSNCFFKNPWIKTFWTSHSALLFLPSFFLIRSQLPCVRAYGWISAQVARDFLRCSKLGPGGRPQKIWGFDRISRCFSEVFEVFLFSPLGH